MRVTLVISGIASGGAERVLSIMANHWAEHGEQVTLVTLDSAEHDFYALSPLINRIGLNMMADSHGAGQAIRHSFARIRRLRKVIQGSQPDAVISFVDKINVLVLMATRGLKVPVIVSERVDPRYYSIGRRWDLLRRITYPFADAVVVQTEGVKRWASSVAPRENVRVIPNPVEEPGPPTAGERIKMPEGPLVVAMGRLTLQKGFDLLLQAFKQCSESHAEWSLVLLGEGSERANLEAKVLDLGLGDRVHFAGRVKEPAHLLRQADLFVLSSRFEGFPNALLEAMACGMAVISFDCPSGPRDIITNGTNGVLVPAEDVDGLGEAMGRLMTDSAERLRLGEQAVRSLDRFQVGTIMSVWESVLAEVSKVSPSGTVASRPVR